MSLWSFRDGVNQAAIDRMDVNFEGKHFWGLTVRHGVAVIIRLEDEDLIALRDALNLEFPPSQTDPQAGVA